MTPSTNQRVLVTGGLGFIGSHFVQLLLAKGYEVINVDKRTYASRQDIDFTGLENYQLIEKDICDLTSLPAGISYVVNFAAESHVQNSIYENQVFFRSNVQGVYNLLELVRTMEGASKPTFIQISTDEVYGDTKEGVFSETDRLKPSSPYSATKAAADQLVLGWIRTYGVQARICRSCNNYGFGQNSEKLIPRTTKLAFQGKKMTVHGSGLYSREWIHVEDNCEAILRVMEKGIDGEIYNITTGVSRTNLEVIQLIHKMVGVPEGHFLFVEDRPGQDIRYAVSWDKIRALGWEPRWTLETYLPLFIKACEERSAQFKATNTLKRRAIRKLFGPAALRFFDRIT